MKKAIMFLALMLVTVPTMCAVTPDKIQSVFRFSPKQLNAAKLNTTTSVKKDMTSVLSIVKKINPKSKLSIQAMTERASQSAFSRKQKEDRALALAGRDNGTISPFRFVKKQTDVQSVQKADLASFAESHASSAISLPKAFCSGYQDIPDYAYVRISSPGVNRQESWNVNPGICGYDSGWGQWPDRSSGYRWLQYGDTSEGYLFFLEGFMWTTPEGERVIIPLGIYPVYDGFVLPRPIYVPQRMMTTGLKPTILVKISGTVMTEPVINDPNAYYYYLDDGSMLQTADPAVRGIKVVNPYYNYAPPFHHPKPPVKVGDKVIITGSFSYETDPSGKVRPIFYQTTDFLNDVPSRGTTKYTVSGTVTADPEASGQTVMVTCDGGTTTAVFDENGVATYEISLPTGEYNLYARALGYEGYFYPGDGIWVVDVDSDYTDVNFILYPAEVYDPATGGWVLCKKVMDVKTEKSTIPHDGTSTTKGFVLVRALDSGRYAGEIVSLTVSKGTFLSRDSVTDEQGKAHFTLQSSTKAEVATIVATAGNLKSSSLCYFHNEGEPIVTIWAPYDQEVVSGICKTGISTESDNGQITKGMIIVDGKEYSPLIEQDLDSDTPAGGFSTWGLSNGKHTIQACVTILADEGTTQVYSNSIDFIVDNSASLVSNKDVLSEDDSTPFLFSGSLKDTGNWEVKVMGSDLNDLNAPDPCVYSVSGTGTVVNVTWDGKISGQFEPGVYSVVMSVNGIEIPEAGMTIGVSHPMTGSTILVVGTFKGDEWLVRRGTKQCLNAVIKYTKARGHRVKVLIDPWWEIRPDTEENKNSVAFNLLHGGQHYFYLNCHGTNVKLTNYKADGGNVKPEYVGHYRTYLSGFKDGQKIFGAKDWVIDKYQNSVQSVSDLGLPSHRFMLVHNDACDSGGDFRTEEDRTIARAFGCRDDEQGSTYIGWKNYNNTTFIWNYKGFTIGFWRYFAATTHWWSAEDSISKVIADPSYNGLITSWGPYLYLYSDFSASVCWLVP